MNLITSFVQLRQHDSTSPGAKWSAFSEKRPATTTLPCRSKDLTLSVGRAIRRSVPPAARGRSGHLAGSGY